MDLVKVVLPTITLGRNSLLEMYANLCTSRPASEYLRLEGFQGPSGSGDEMVPLLAFYAGRKEPICQKTIQPHFGCDCAASQDATK